MLKSRQINTLAALLLCVCSASALMPIRWVADGSKPDAYATQIAQGETRDLVCTLRNYGNPVALSDSATASMWYQTNGMGAVYFPGGAGAVTTNGVVTSIWSPALDVGASSYNFVLGVEDGGERSYTAYGVIRMRPSPGFVPNTLPLPKLITAIDFDLITPLNAPWTTYETVTNLIGTIEGVGGGGIVIEADAVALEALTNHVTNIFNPHHVTAEQVGAIPANWDSGIWRLEDPLSFGDDDIRTEIMGAGLFFYSVPQMSAGLFVSGGETKTGSWRWPDTKSISPLIKRDEMQAKVTSATNAVISSIFELQNALLVVSNDVATIQTNGVVIWSSTSGGGSVPPSVTNELWQSIAALQGTVSSFESALAGITRDWGSYAPDGSVNPDSDYMLYINRPATVWASGFQWSTSGGHAVLSTTGMVAFAVGDSGEMRIGPGDGTNYFGFVQGGSVEVGASAEGITVAGEVATILYPYESGDFPVLWFTVDLAIPFEPMTGVVWVDNEDGTATVTAPATTPRGFWRATTSATYTAEFRSTMPARFTGGVFGATNQVPVIYDSTIQISSGGKTYRIPAEEL